MSDHELNDDDDSVDDEVDVGYDENIQLGFIERKNNELFHNSDWNTWDGGKVGGFPVWLNPVGIPSVKQLECSGCQGQLSFLLQIYCPLDDVDGAFHRSLYLFCCKKRTCIEHESVKCFRNQLPEVNPFYCQETSAVPVQYPNLCQLCGCLATSSCSSCKSVHYCSRAHQKEHWKQHKIDCKTLAAVASATILPINISTTARSALTRPSDPVQLAHVFPEYEISVEAEEMESSEEQLLSDGKVMQGATIWEDAVTKGGADEASDAALTQSDYNKALGGERHDPVYISFLTRIQRGGGDQVLRYNRWEDRKEETDATSSQEDSAVHSADGPVRPPVHGPLLLSHDPALLRRIQCVPDCERCGAKRAFEFQVMPQLLHFLQVDSRTTVVGEEAVSGGEGDEPLPPVPEDENEGSSAAPPAVTSGTFQNNSNKDIDWGSIDVYTCTASCSSSSSSISSDSDKKQTSGEAVTYGGYVNEYVIIQSPPVMYRSAQIKKKIASEASAAGATDVIV